MNTQDVSGAAKNAHIFTVDRGTAAEMKKAGDSGLLHF
jgi:hypothetical protein